MTDGVDSGEQDRNYLDGRIRARRGRLNPVNRDRSIGVTFSGSYTRQQHIEYILGSWRRGFIGALIVSSLGCIRIVCSGSGIKYLHLGSLCKFDHDSPAKLHPCMLYFDKSAGLKKWQYMGRVSDNGLKIASSFVHLFTQLVVLCY